MSVGAVFLDVGETLASESRMWAEWADWLGVPRLGFFAALGAVIERREHHRRVFDIFRPGFDIGRAREERAAQGRPDRSITAEDIYADAVPCMLELKRRGYVVGIVGNQPVEAEQVFRSMGAPADHVASSAGWGVEKPSPEFFGRIVALADLPAGRIAYVGDRLDNDVLPAMAAGLVGVFLRRGPWGIVQGGWPEVARARLRVETLSELPDALDRL
jgi:HAD superfamily hydrolase (TIGR01549 family)